MASSLASLGTRGGGCHSFVASANWGTAAFRGCNWCRRDRDCENPIEKDRRQRPNLQFRSERHHVCNPCTSALRKSEPDLLLPGNARKKEDRLKEVQTVLEAYDSHCNLVKRYENCQNGVEQKPILPRSKRARDAEDDDSNDDAMAPEKVVKTMHGTELESRRLVAVFWPKHVYKTIEKRDPPQQSLTKWSLSGTARTGLMRHRKHGTPPGTEEIYQRQFATATAESLLSKSSDQLREGETDDWYKASSAAVTVNTKLIEDGEGVDAMAIKSAGAASYGPSSSKSQRKRGEDDDMDLQWDTGLSIVGPVDVDGEPVRRRNKGSGSSGPRPSAAKQTPKTKQGKSSTEGLSSSPEVKQQATTPTSDKVTKASAQKRDREINLSEKFVLEVQQIQRSLGSSTTCMSVTVKQANALAEKISARLAPELIALYSQGYEGGARNRI